MLTIADMAMNGYTKLFNSIIASTVWSEPHTTRIVWISMLAMANQRGVVEASIPGLAVLARVTREECEEAIRILESPDLDSRSQEHEGRRIQKIDGGWLILNHGKYRAKLNADERREYNRIKQQEFREKKSANVSNVIDMSALSAHTDTDTDTDTDTKKKSQNPSPTKSVGGELGSPEFRQFWEAYPKKVDRQEAVRAWVKGMCDGSLGAILAGLESWKRIEQWRDVDKVPYPSTWLNKRRWKDTPPAGEKLSPSEQKARNTDAAIERVKQRLNPQMVEPSK